jgi:hypothetical protein
VFKAGRSRAPAADLPVPIIPWDQVVLIRVLAEYTSSE